MTKNAANALTVPDVATALGVNVRSLQQGFRQWRNTTPLQFLRQTRLRRVRDELCRSGGETEVTTVALRDGFMHLLVRPDHLGRGIRLGEIALHEGLLPAVQVIHIKVLADGPESAAGPRRGFVGSGALPAPDLLAV